MDQTANISTVGSATSPTLIPSHFFQSALLFCLLEFSRRSVSFLRALLHASIFNQLHTLCHFFPVFLSNRKVYTTDTQTLTPTHIPITRLRQTPTFVGGFTRFTTQLIFVALHTVCLLSKCDYINVKTKADSGDYLGRITTA